MKRYLKLLDFFGLKQPVTFYDKLADQLIEHEGYRDTPYYDSVGVLTCGVGHNLQEPMSEAAIGLLLLEDIKRAEADLDAVLPNCWEFADETRRLALIDMMFNLGRTRFSKFVLMISAIKAGDWKEASRQAVLSRWRRQVGKRAVTIARMLRDGDSVSEH